jgi:hypothetical protein
MTALLVLIVFVALLVLAGRYGADSRTTRPGRQL